MRPAGVRAGARPGRRPQGATGVPGASSTCGWDEHVSVARGSAVHSVRRTHLWREPSAMSALTRGPQASTSPTMSVVISCTGATCDGGGVTGAACRTVAGVAAGGAGADDRGVSSMSMSMASLAAVLGVRWSATLRVLATGVSAMSMPMEPPVVGACASGVAAAGSCGKSQVHTCSCPTNSSSLPLGRSTSKSSRDDPRPETWRVAARGAAAVASSRKASATEVGTP